MEMAFYNRLCSPAGKTCLCLIIGFTLFWGIGSVHADEKPTPEKELSPGAQAVTQQEEDEYFELLKLLTDTIDQVDRNYIEKVDRRELVEAAIQGVMSQLDSHSTYVPPDQVEAFRTDMESSFGGIGVHISLDNGQPKILCPLYGSPSYRAGLISGDVITSIEGEDTKGHSIDEIVRQLKGPVESAVTFTVFHPHNNTSDKVTIERETIQIETILGNHRNKKGSWVYINDPQRGIAYIRITAFGRNTDEHLKEVLEKLTRDKMKGLVLDLRFNPGGLLTSAVAVSDLFLSKGKIVSTTGRNVKERTWEAKKDGSFEGFPMVILVNKYSASASEIVAACLQDHGRAIVVGERTWGKGSIQNVIQLENGRSALKLTTSGYQRPSGKKINRLPGEVEKDDWGVIPDKDYEIRLTKEETATLHFDQRRRNALPKSNSDGTTAVSFDPDALPPFDDRQLNLSLRYIRKEFGEDVELVKSPPKVVSQLLRPKTASERQADPAAVSDTNDNRPFPFLRRFFERR